MLTREIEIPQRPWTSAEAFRHCERITREHYENFPVASLLLPKERRKYVCAIYAFARTADDFADEPGLTTAERIESLNSWELQLNECLSGNARHRVFAALAETIDRFQIPPELFRNLLQAFRQDVTTHRYKTFAGVLDYCLNSANPVGRLVLLLFNYRSESLAELSDSICTALQLTNFWQDIRVDAGRDRIYVPAEDMKEFSYTEEELTNMTFNPEFKRLLSFEIERTRDLFLRGKPLLSEVGKDLVFELKLTWNGGMKILEKIERNHYDVFRNRPILTLSNKVGIFFSSMLA